MDCISSKLKVFSPNAMVVEVVVDTATLGKKVCQTWMHASSIITTENTKSQERKFFIGEIVCE